MWKNLVLLTGDRNIHTGWTPKGYKSPDNENGAEDVVLEGEQSQAHVGEYEILCEEVKDLKELQETYNINDSVGLEMYEYTTRV